MRIDIVIPNYNGRALLEEYLPSAIRAVKGVGNVIVVDDASTDGSAELLRDRFPEVKLIAREDNGGFSAAVNDGLRAAEGDLVALLNNDVQVSAGFLDPIIPLFEDESVFAVSPRIILPDRGGERFQCRGTVIPNAHPVIPNVCEESAFERHEKRISRKLEMTNPRNTELALGSIDEGAKTGFWYHGMFYTDQRAEVSAVTPVLYATGCAAVYRRSMLHALGGFDEAYSPFYWEDADLGYRAWKRGWLSLYQPRGLVHHRHSASISRMDTGLTARIKARNGLFFIWRNIEDRALVRSHRRWLPLVIARRIAAGDRSFPRGWRDAYSRRLEASQARDSDSAHRVLLDREIFDHVGIDLLRSAKPCSPPRFGEGLGERFR